MINKKQTGKAWKWKAAAFIPVACLLLMSFSNTLEKKDEFTTIADKSEKHKTATVDDKVRKQWTEADFIDIKTINEKEITDKNLLTIRLDLDWGVTIFKYNKGVYTGTTECKYKYNDDLLVDNTDYNDKELKSVIDYKNVTTHTKRFFKEADINGKKEMVSLYKILIAKESRVSDKEYKELLNFIGNTITKIRNNHSIERYGEKFAELDKEKKDIIEQLVPLRVYYKEKKFSLPVSGKRANFVRAKDSKILSLNIKNLVFLINRYDFLWADETMLSPMSNNRTRYIKKYFDYTTATEKTKSLFKSVNINNKQVMVPTSKLYVYQEPPMNKENRMAKVKDFINLTKMIFNKIKDNYSKQIFSKSYNQLSANNKQEIDSILPDKIIANDKPISLAKAKVIRKKDIIYIIEK